MLLVRFDLPTNSKRIKSERTKMQSCLVYPNGGVQREEANTNVRHKGAGSTSEPSLRVVLHWRSQTAFPFGKKRPQSKEQEPCRCHVVQIQRHVQVENASIDNAHTYITTSSPVRNPSRLVSAFPARQTKCTAHYIFTTELVFRLIKGRIVFRRQST
jgi:hypothetical protein